MQTERASKLYNMLSGHQPPCSVATDKKEGLKQQRIQITSKTPDEKQIYLLLVLQDCKRE